MSSSQQKANSGGFSLVELLIAMVITMVLMVAATTLLASALRVRSRENQKSDALADAQRAINIMSREIADSGFNLNNNGIVGTDSGLNEIRIRSNLNKFDYDVSDVSRNNVQDAGEDISYFTNVADQTKYLARHDKFGTGSTVLANRIDSLNIHYFDQKVTYTAAPGASDISDESATEVAPSAAKYIVIAVSVTLDAVGTPGAAGYQPPYSVLICSDVTLRNADLWSY
ncbi:MAG TPA: prepilin-type N-terminal cleavage/methylation domain-containing protein [Pyrinomonadaceae bacterium]|jgi:type II secretory pathway pseudopilin PulG|nr:prepilin-type N-terminal cleavage/methylation domain-containing protein [Pyrinomonadaceae bacterium]